MNTAILNIGNMPIYPEMFFITILLCYIIFLHYRLNKKNNLLRFYFKEIIKSKNRIDKEDLLKFLENLKNPEFSNILLKDKLLDEEIQEFLFESDAEIKLFLHYTAKEDVAKKILHEGFKFVNSFYKTAEQIYNDKLYLIQKHNEHKQYGHYVIVICIAKEVYDFYTKQVAGITKKDVVVEQILTEKPPEVDENSENVYTLPQQFIKGYFNYATGNVVENANYNPDYRSKEFDKNIQIYKK